MNAAWAGHPEEAGALILKTLSRIRSGAYAVGLALSFAAAAHADPVRVDGPQAPGFADVVAAASPAVVSVRVQSGPTHPANDGEAFGFPQSLSRTPFATLLKGIGDGDDRADQPHDIRPVSQGSGFFISGDGYVVTDNDVISGGDTFQIILNDGTTFPARLVGQDPRTDIAVLKVETPPRSFVYLGFADDAKVRVGDWIVTVGNPNGLGGSIAVGVISGRGRDAGAGPFDDYIQFNAPANPGDAGEPALNLSGEVVGMYAALFSPEGGMGVAFAIPASVVKKVAADLIRDGSVSRGWLGVSLQGVTPDIADSVGLPKAAGALVADIAPDAPAKSAGISAGTVVTSIDGKSIDDPRDLARAVSSRKPGDAVELGLWTNGKPETVTVTLGRLPEPRPAVPPRSGAQPDKLDPKAPLARFGLTVAPTDDQRGIVVTDVQSGSPADQQGLRPGDLVVSVNGTHVKSAGDVLDAIAVAAKQNHRAVLFQLENGSRSRFVALPIDTG